MPTNWVIEDNQLILTLNDEANRAIIILDVSEDGDSIHGSYIQFRETSDVLFAHLSDTPELGDVFFSFEPWVSVPFDERIHALNDFSQFEDDGVVLLFTYDLNRRDLYMDLIEEFDLDAITAGHNDRNIAIEDFKLFMADYLFRFSTGTHFTFGSEEMGEGTTQVMLVPVGFYGTGGEVTTTSSKAFFGTPYY